MMNGRQGTKIWLAFACVIAFQVVVRCKNGITMDEAYEASYTDENTVEQSSLDDRISDNLNEVRDSNSNAQNSHGIDGVDRDASTLKLDKVRNELNRKNVGVPLEAQDGIFSVGKTAKNFEEFLTEQGKPSANARPQNEPENNRIGKKSDILKQFLVQDQQFPAKVATSVNAVRQNLPPNVTILDKMRDLMSYESSILDFSILDSFDWFDDTTTLKSRMRRDSEAYHYRRFQQPLRAYIPENSPPGTKVLEIPRNFDGALEIVEPVNPIFRIRSGTGILETTVRLDFESEKVYNLIIQDSGVSSFYNHDVIVYVTDQNDNEPTFAMNEYKGNVNTASRVGSFVAQLNASDPDSRERGRLGFLIGDRNSAFTVNPKTWVMETNGRPLDLSQNSFPVNIRAFDQGYPRRESSTRVLTVNKANNPPRFSQSEYTFSYPEITLPGIVIGRVVAISLSNIPVGYEVVPTSDVFAINQRGELSLKRSVDFETADGLTTTIITIRASELTDSNPLSSQASVTLVVTNYDENPAIFTRAIYNAQLDEDVGIGTSVTTVTVTDCDCGVNCQCTGTEMNFALEDANAYFDISATGEIRTAKLFDFDIQSVYSFAVVAWDRAGSRGESEPARSYVSVKLRDVNNNAPKFSESRYRFFVDEDSEIGHLVGVVQATDKDNLGSPLTYSITASSPKSGLFRIPDSRFGIVVVASSLKAETESVFVLNVEASDGVLRSQTQVEINVEDVNDNAPQFTSCPESVSVEENISPGSRVTVLKAVDSDRGIHANIEYFIEDSYDLYTPDHQLVFVVNNQSGKVETALKLDREQKSQYFLISSAKDQTLNSQLRQVGYCQFVIHVSDENDNYPIFEVEEYQTSVKTDLAVGSRVLQVKAIDHDVGENARVTYTIDKGNDKNLFAVGLDGWITVKSSLIGQLGEVSLTITAGNVKAYHKDAKSDNTHETTVKILFTTKNLPRFSQPLFQTNVLENTTVSSTVLTLTTVPTSAGGSMIYSLATLRLGDFPFRLDHSTGAVTLTQPLDYEKRKQYVFSVNAKQHTDSGTDNNQVETAVEINVVDVNDVAPVFARSRYDATVSEGAQPGTMVIRIFAIDYDPLNVAISYKMEELLDSHSFQLTYRDSSIEIITTRMFDRETREYYDVNVVATDNGNPQLQSTAYVKVRVLDENDSPPVFDAAHYTVTVPENTPVGTTIKTVVSRDMDFGINARALFSIAAGNDGRFQMTSQEVANGNEGHLVVARPLDFEANSEYNLTVVASDAKFSNSTVITVKITKSDNKPPQFGKNLYDTNLEENTPSGMLVLAVSAVDPDTPSNQLVYTLNTTIVPYFNIGSTTGEITTTGVPLNVEKVPVVVFPVHVTDGNSIARALVVVNVLDVNEPPYFPNSPYIGFVPENKPIGTPVRYITAFDDDDPKLANGKNSKISYAIDRSSGETQLDADGGLFSIDSTTGLLTTSGVFNLETIRRNLTILVRASDEGVPKLSSTTLVTIVVEDISEFPPKFSQDGFVGEVAEDVSLGSVVLEMATVDEDFTNVGHEYAITEGNYPFAFYVVPSTGQIQVAGILDYETKPTYNLTVSVLERSIDRTFPTDHAVVYIKILDANDHPPIFQPKSYHRRLQENVTIGTEVRTVTCSDMDAGANAVPRFSITDGNVGDVFEVVTDPTNDLLGVVKVADHLDREKISSYMLEITATDIGGLKDTAVLAVQIEDVNDTPPMFSPAFYEASVIGGVRREQYITTINASDPDQSPNGVPFTFQLNSTNDEFQLKNPTGNSVELYTKLYEFIRETTPLYHVKVVATDAGNPAQSAEMMVFVSVLDDTANQEAFDGSLRIIIFALDGNFSGGVIGEVYYKDNDYQVDQNEYTVVSQEPGNHFSVNSSTGHLSCVTADIPIGVYSINVTVRDQNSAKSVNSEITVTVRNLSASAVQHAVALRFPMGNSAMFIDGVYMKLITTLANIFQVPADHVYVFSVAQSTESLVSTPTGVDVWVAINDRNDVFMNPNYVFTQIETNYEKIVALGVNNVEIGYDKCAVESHSVGVCKNVLTAHQSYSVVSGYHGQIPAPSSSLTVVVVDTDLQATYTVLPEPATSCALLPCLNGGTCHDILPEGYVCECPHEYRGPECQATTRTFDKSNSYIWLEPLSAYELSSFSFEFMSQPSSSSGLLVYQGAVRKGGNNGMKDFLAVSLISGYVTVAISLGGRALSLNLRNGQRLDDGAWHHVEIKRMKKEIRLVVDHCESVTVTEEDGRFFEDRAKCEVISHTFGDYIYLNGLGPLQIGGSSFAFSHPSVTAQSFYGCIRNIYDNNRMYDLHNPLKVVNASLGCKRGCQSECQNEGYCEAEMYNGKSCCTCVPGFTGCDCSQRSPSLWYIENSFSEYNISNMEQQSVIQDDPDEPSLPVRHRRHIFARIFRYFFPFHTNLVLRIRVLANVSNAIFFRSASAAESSSSELGIKNGHLYYTCKFADEMKTVTLTGANITDNKWHTVRVSRRGNTVSLQMDFKAKAYGTTGGVVRLTSLSGGSLYTGGIPRYAEKILVSSNGNGSMSSRSMMHGGRKVETVHHDFQGCTGGVTYNGQELDEKFQFSRFRVVKGCPCATTVLDCKNNSTCTDEEPPYCACSEGFTGQTCDQVVTEPTPRAQITVPGERKSNRNRLMDPVWICVFLLCLILLIFILCLLHILPIVGGKRPLIEEEAHDSIMAYQEHGGEEKDATGYDVTVLMKHSRRRVTLTTATSAAQVNGGLEIDGVDSRGGKRMVSSSQTRGVSNSGGEYGAQKMENSSEYKGTAAESRAAGAHEIESERRLKSWIMARVSEADQDNGFFPVDEMDHVRYEGKYSDFDYELSEIELDEDLNERGQEVWSIDWDNFRK
ncbi:protocadherin-like protein [Dendronephthya gigantea]|uniref:protocadherin-like protein n=1 Tax=Dendronephthya gigantea TaxID=151771 RepID=UPI00106AED58|nr:protocadherin-like protein [Dendronephthya gigantea]